MASFWVRAVGQFSLPGLQKRIHTAANGCRRSLTSLPHLRNFSGMHHISSINVYETSGLKMNISMTGCNRSFHSSCQLLKKFKESDFEKLSIFDPNEKYLCATEMFVLHKFCQCYRRFTFKEFKPTGTYHGEAGNTSVDTSLRTFKLVDRGTDSSKDKKIKEIHFHNDDNPTEKLRKIVEFLINHGRVNLFFDKKITRVQNKIKQRVSQFGTYREIHGSGLTIMVIAKDLDTKALRQLMEEIQEHEADYINSVKEMMAVVKEK